MSGAGKSGARRSRSRAHKVRTASVSAQRLSEDGGRVAESSAWMKKRYGEASSQHQGESFVELVGGRRGTLPAGAERHLIRRRRRAPVRRASSSQRAVARASSRRRHHPRRGQRREEPRASAGEGDLVGLGSDAGIARPPAASGVEPRREKRRARPTISRCPPRRPARVEPATGRGAVEEQMASSQPRARRACPRRRRSGRGRDGGGAGWAKQQQTAPGRRAPEVKVSTRTKRAPTTPGRAAFPRLSRSSAGLVHPALAPRVPLPAQRGFGLLHASSARRRCKGWIGTVAARRQRRRHHRHRRLRHARPAARRR